MSYVNQITPDAVFYGKQRNPGLLTKYPGFENMVVENLPREWPVSTLYLSYFGRKQVTLDMEDFLALAKTLKVIDKYQADPKSDTKRRWNQLEEVYPAKPADRFQGDGAPLHPIFKVCAAVRDCWQRKQWAATVNCSTSKIASIARGGLMKEDAEWLLVLLLQDNQIPCYSSMSVEDMAYEIYQRYCDFLLQDGLVSLWGEVTPDMSEVGTALEIYAQEFYGQTLLDSILKVDPSYNYSLRPTHYPSPARGSEIYVAYRSKLRLGLNR